MDLSSKFTMYDLFAMVIPGFLILLLFGCFCGYLPLDCETVNNGWFIAFVLILSYLAGLLWNKFSERMFCKFRNGRYFIKQQYDKFAREYQEVSEKDIRMKIEKNFKHEYYKAYYCLMNINCLNSIPVLEAQVALIRNLIIIIPFYIIALIHCDNAIYVFVKSQLHNTFGLAVLLLVMFAGMIYLLFQLQNKIYYLVWEGNEYLKET
jgi:hypothetical protein